MVFDTGTKAGEKVKFKSKDKCYCIFAAPGNRMMVHEQNPSTELTITCLLYTSPSPRDATLSRMPSSA